jgi:hypothetical protein
MPVDFSCNFVARVANCKPAVGDKEQIVPPALVAMMIDKDLIFAIRFNTIPEFRTVQESVNIEKTTQMLWTDPYNGNGRGTHA